MDKIVSLLLITGVFDFFLAGIIFIHGSRKRAEFFFILFLASIASWVGSIALLRATIDPAVAFYSLAWSYVSGTAIAASFLFFVYSFIGRRMSPLFGISLTLAGIIVGLSSLFSPDFIKRIAQYDSYDKILILGPLHWIFDFYFFSVMGTAFFMLLKTAQALKTSNERMNAMLMFTGIGIAAVVGSLCNIVFVDFHNAGYIGYGPVAINVLASFIAYAIMRHNLMSIRVIGAEFFTVTLILFSFVRLILSGNPSEALFNGLALLFVIGFGVLLIRSVLKEVRDKEKIAMLAQELEERNEELKKLDKAKSEFLSIASHQLRAPLTVIKGYVSMALEGTFGDVTDGLKDALGKVFFSAEQLVRLVSSLLDLSRIESGGIHYDFVETNIADLITGIIASLEPSASQKNIHLAFENSAGSVSCVCDANNMREVVMNLIDNAIKYSPHGGDVFIHQEVVLKKKKQVVRVSVRDNGIGVAQGDAGRLFGKFVRTKEARKVDPNGMGIGLYFIKRVVEDHGGKIWVESKGLGAGSTFVFEVPVGRK